jgi:hypothetical protein
MEDGKKKFGSPDIKNSAAIAAMMVDAQRTKRMLMCEPNSYPLSMNTTAAGLRHDSLGGTILLPDITPTRGSEI